MRAAATLFGRVLADDAILVLRSDAKQLADACGATRDLDVFLMGVLAEAEETLAERIDAAEQLRSFRAAALRLRRGRHNAVRHVLTSEIFSIFDARVTGLLATPMRRSGTVSLGHVAAASAAAGNPDLKPVPEAADFARSVLRRRDRKLRKGLDRFDRLDASERHALRLRVKKQRYAASFLAGLFDRKAAAAYIRGAADLQDALGLANDRIVATRVVADIRVAARPKGRLDWIAGMLTGWLVMRAQGNGKDEHTLTVAVRRFRKAPRLWRHGAGGGNGAGG
jgi:CHAD domain-containing protein